MARTKTATPEENAILEETAAPEENAILEETAAPEENAILEETAAPEENATPEETTTTEEAAAPEEQKEPTEKIFLFKDDGAYKDDLFVSVNGRNFQIQRGVEVEVPACVAEVIRNSDRQKQLAEQRLEKLVEQYIKER
jgi:hypothetical protein